MSLWSVGNIKYCTVQFMLYHFLNCSVMYVCGNFIVSVVDLFAYIKLVSCLGTHLILAVRREVSCHSSQLFQHSKSFFLIAYGIHTSVQKTWLQIYTNQYDTNDDGFEKTNCWYSL